MFLRFNLPQILCVLSSELFVAGHNFFCYSTAGDQILPNPLEEFFLERTAVQSHEIAIVGYDKPAATLEVTFRRGGVYHYFGVPESIHQALMTAESLGTFFADQVKDKFSYKKIS